MATITTTGLPLPKSATGVSRAQIQVNRPRRLSREAGHALEILGHAIEYLSDEFVHEGGALDAHDPQIEAVQLLMGLNRQVYFECPQMVTLRERCSSFLHHHLL
jgi:hypothetical protein